MSIHILLKWSFRIRSMLSDQLLHPDHIIPASKLIPALIELSDHAIAKMRMEFHAIVRQVFVLLRRIGDTGVHIQKSLFFQRFFQCRMQLSTDSHMLAAFIYIDGCLNRPCIRFSGMKLPGIRIPLSLIHI